MIAAPPPPTDVALATLLDAYAPLAPCARVPEVSVFQARGLIEVWTAAEALAEQPLPAPFWAYAWPAGVALARTLLDRPEWVRGLEVLDIGCGGGVASLAAARAQAAGVVANDVDGWSLVTVRLAAERQQLSIETLLGDLTRADAGVPHCDLVLCADLSYERRSSAPMRALLARLRRRGARVLVADAERKYFSADGLTPVVDYEIEVPLDLEGVEVRTARVFEMV
jgi:predicted nicotinamide N-methyase